MKVGGADANSRDSSDTRPLLAAARGNVIRVKDLIAAGARLNDQDPQGRSALTLARLGKHGEVVKILQALVAGK